VRLAVTKRNALELVCSILGNGSTVLWSIGGDLGWWWFPQLLPKDAKFANFMLVYVLILYTAVVFPVLAIRYVASRRRGKMSILAGPAREAMCSAGEDPQERRIVTEAEWLQAIKPSSMLDYLGKSVARRIGSQRFKDRLYRLFGCACCRRMLRIEHDEWVVQAIEIAERIADGQPLLNECKAHLEMRQRLMHTPTTDADGATRFLLEYQDYFDLPTAAMVARCARFLLEFQEYFDLPTAAMVARCAAASGGANPRSDDLPRSDDQVAEARVQAEILRDIIGNPFHSALVPRSRPVGNDDTVTRLAAAIYAEHAFDRVPLLADALEDAGCTDAELLGHLRGPGPHVRGCWAVDRILGRE
jgi:hypothetical protein